MSNDVSLRVKAQRLGGKLSAMVLPNLGAFMGWGILTALGIWLANDTLKGFGIDDWQTVKQTTTKIKELMKELKIVFKRKIFAFQIQQLDLELILIYLIMTQSMKQS